ncbi:H/ACA ribonucleoprotein complex subunit [Aphelenchoides besseyi]|nr:H/ACA ribonucleoprotein complex subunit [Aphelenchoides besseyi]
MSRGGRFGGNRGGRGGGRGGRGGNRSFADQGPPENVVEVGHFMHSCENDLVCTTTCGKIPFFNAPVYFENKEQIGKIDEIFGSPQENGFSVKVSDGVKASSFKADQKLFIDPAKLLPVERFTNAPQRARGGSRGRGGPPRGGGGRGSFKGASGERGGRGNSRGGGNFDRGGRGSFNRGGNFQGGRGNSRGRGGDFKRPYSGGANSGTPQNKRIKFDD